jgi:hypothetical protein
MTPMSQGGGMGAAFNAFPAAQQQAMRQQFLRQQMEGQQSEAELRKIQILAAQRKAQKDAEMLAMIQRRLGSQGAMAQSQMALEQGAAQGSVGPTNANAQRLQQGGGFPFSLNDVLSLKAAGGPDFLEAYKFASTPEKMEGGSTYRDRVTGTERFMPKVPDGMSLANGVVSTAPGFLDTLTAVTDAQEAAKARYGPPIRMPTADGREILMSPAEFARGVPPSRARAPAQTPAQATPRSFPRVAPAAQQGMDSTRLSILTTELDQAIRDGDPQTAASVQREIDLATGGGGVGKSTAVAQAEEIRATRAKASAGLDAGGAKSAQEQATGARGVVMIADQIEKLIGDKDAPKVYGNAIPDRIAMGLNTIGGNETPKAINTNQVRMLGQQMVLARGSLGAGVSVADAERYDKAAGDFSRAKTVSDMLAAVRIMRDIAKTYGSNEAAARQQLDSGRPANVMRYNPKTDTFSK